MEPPPELPPLMPPPLEPPDEPPEDPPDEPPEEPPDEPPDMPPLDEPEPLVWMLEQPTSNRDAQATATQLRIKGVNLFVVGFPRVMICLQDLNLEPVPGVEFPPIGVNPR